MVQMKAIYQYQILENNVERYGSAFKLISIFLDSNVILFKNSTNGRNKKIISVLEFNFIAENIS